MQLFYNPDIKKNEENLVFPRDESRHIVKVLRKKEGDLLKVTNGRGKLFTVKLTEASLNRCQGKILGFEEEPPVSWRLHLAVAPTKMNDRYEWFLEKATEIGIHEISPVFCEHSERKVVKLNRFERVLQSAMKQSLHYNLPKLNEAQNFSEFVQKEIPGQKFIAHCEEGIQRLQLKDEVKPLEEITILIGPEGDFSPSEIALALENDWIPVSLGNSRLRTETAAIVACHTVVLANQ